MGSSSCSLDTDSTSISNCSNDGNDIFYTNEDTFESSQRANTPTRKEVIVETAIAHTLDVDIVIDTDRQVVSPCRDPIKSSSKSMKRSRSKSDLLDLLSYASARKLIACPRSVSFAESSISSVEPARERKYGQNWQSACSNARHGYDNSLPSMEEAANLFGFSGIWNWMHNLKSCWSRLKSMHISSTIHWSLCTICYNHKIYRSRYIKIDYYLL